MKQRNLVEHFWDCISSKYFQFSGRASRSEFWGYILFSVLLSYVFKLVDDVIVRIMMYDYLQLGFHNIGDLLLIVPGVAVGVRCFHDTGRSGWIPIAFGGVSALTSISLLTTLVGINWMGPLLNIGSNGTTVWFGFVAVVTVCLGIYYIIIAVQAGTPGLNTYGPDPLNPHLGNEIDQIGEE